MKNWVIMWIEKRRLFSHIVIKYLYCLISEYMQKFDKRKNYFWLDTCVFKLENKANMSVL
jgi:hypothetical protein